MDQKDIYLVVVAIVVVALDIIVRVKGVGVARDKREWFYKSLLEMQAGLSARNHISKVTSPHDDLLAHALLAYFQQSFTSRQVMAALATSVDGMEGRQLEKQIAARVAEKWNRELSINAIRRVIMILMGANLVDLRDGKFALTNVGWNLFLKTKNAAGPRWSEAGSRGGARGAPKKLMTLKPSVNQMA
jgi:hypothetical protein